MKRKNRYSAIIEKIFTSKFKPGMKMVDFAREPKDKFEGRKGLVVERKDNVAARKGNVIARTGLFMARPYLAVEGKGLFAVEKVKSPIQKVFSPGDFIF
ncbi:MAG: hypothetical protein WAO02_10165 [Verrucomicrobiia bacterium]